MKHTKKNFCRALHNDVGELAVKLENAYCERASNLLCHYEELSLYIEREAQSTQIAHRWSVFVCLYEPRKFRLTYCKLLSIMLPVFCLFLGLRGLTPTHRARLVRLEQFSILTFASYFFSGEIVGGKKRLGK